MTKEQLKRINDLSFEIDQYEVQLNELERIQRDVNQYDETDRPKLCGLNFYNEMTEKNNYVDLSLLRDNDKNKIIALTKELIEKRLGTKKRMFENL